MVMYWRKGQWCITDVLLPWLFFKSVDFWGGFVLSIVSCTPSLPLVRAFPGNKHQIQGTWMVFVLHEPSKGSQRLDQRTKTSFGDGENIPSWRQLSLNGSDSWGKCLKKESNAKSRLSGVSWHGWSVMSAVDEDEGSRCAWLPSIS